MMKAPTLRLGPLTFHMGADYACVMGERQTTDNAIVGLYGQSRDVEAYGKAIEMLPDLLAFVHAIAEACPVDAPRDHYNRYVGPRNTEPLRQLALKYQIRDGGVDTQEQAGMVAQKMLESIR